MPATETATQKQAERLVRELNALSQQSLISGEVRAFGVSETQYGFYRYDGTEFLPLTNAQWAEAVKPSISRNGTKLKLPEDLSPLIVFEPTSVNTPFKLDLSGPKHSYELRSNGDGRILLVKTQ